jgi:hypothetical protein
LSDIINSYNISKKSSANEIEKEMHNRRSFIDFLQGVLNLNPLARWSPEQAKRHPFITGDPFIGPYIPNMLPQKMPMDIGAKISGKPRISHNRQFSLQGTYQQPTMVSGKPGHVDPRPSILSFNHRFPTAASSTTKPSSSSIC